MKMDPLEPVHPLARVLPHHRREEPVARRDRDRADVHHQEAAGAVRRLHHARREAALPEGRGLLIARHPGDPDATPEQLRADRCRSPPPSRGSPAALPAAPGRARAAPGPSLRCEGRRARCARRWSRPSRAPGPRSVSTEGTCPPCRRRALLPPPAPAPPPRDRGSKRSWSRRSTDREGGRSAPTRAPRALHPGAPRTHPRYAGPARRSRGESAGRSRAPTRAPSRAGSRSRPRRSRPPGSPPSRAPSGRSRRSSSRGPRARAPPRRGGGSAARTSPAPSRRCASMHRRAGRGSTSCPGRSRVRIPPRRLAPPVPARANGIRPARNRLPRGPTPPPWARKSWPRSVPASRSGLGHAIQPLGSTGWPLAHGRRSESCPPSSCPTEHRQAALALDGQPPRPSVPSGAFLQGSIDTLHTARRGGCDVVVGTLEHLVPSTLSASRWL